MPKEAGGGGGVPLGMRISNRKKKHKGKKDPNFYQNQNKITVGNTESRQRHEEEKAYLALGAQGGFLELEAHVHHEVPVGRSL